MSAGRAQRSARPTRRRVASWLCWALVLGLLPTTTTGCGEKDTGKDAIYIAVFMTLSGDDDPGYREVLTWAQTNINAAGGVAGHRLELYLIDLAVLDATALDAYARLVAADDSVVAVVGPEYSSDLLQIADTLVAAQKPLVSPEATSAQISTRYEGRDYVWRTVESDRAQAEVLARIVADGGSRRVSLLTAAGDPYGESFDQWFGAHGSALFEELARTPGDFSPCGCAEATANAMAGEPEALIVIPSYVQESVCIVRKVRQIDADTGRVTAIFMADGGHFEAMIHALGKEAAGIEGTIPAADPSTGFDVAFETIFNRAPIAFGAHVYDAVLLLAYGLERSGGQSGPPLAQALREVVDGRGAPVGWDRYGIARGLAALRRGELPDIRGASGPLDFRPQGYVDPIRTTYAHWRVEGRRFVNVAYYCTDPDTGPTKCLGANPGD